MTPFNVSQLRAEIERRLFHEIADAAAIWRRARHKRQSLAPEPDGTLHRSQAQAAFERWMAAQETFASFIESGGKVMPEHIEQEYGERIRELERKEPGRERSKAAEAGRRQG